MVPTRAFPPSPDCTVKLASHQLAPGSSCVAKLPIAKAEVIDGKAAAGAEDEMKGHGLRGATATPVDEMEEAKAGQAGGLIDVAGLEPGLML